MSKKIVGIKSVIDYFCLVSGKPSKEFIKQADKLIASYNKNAVSCNGFNFKLKRLDEDNIDIWLNLRIFLEKQLEGKELYDIFIKKYKYNYSYVRSCVCQYMSTSTYYCKTEKIYTLAMWYICYYRLVEEDEFFIF